ncbi:MAG: beta-galactosidase [Cyanobacteria bacterium]|nr:beta-galactosidase [Cyanobacteriota bacterium]
MSPVNLSTNQNTGSYYSGAQSLHISYDRYSLIINGQRQLIRSGAMHYFRLPAQSMWRDRLYKLKSGGYNTVDLYFCWDFHSPSPGVYDFHGIRDVEALLEITQELGLFVIARPGPYINAEYTAGGLPGWLIAQPNVVLRNRHPDGTYEWSDTYMKAVRQWWEHIVPIIAKAPNVILMQVENEYATLEMEPTYMQTLIDWTRELGVHVPLFHNDLYASGLYENLVDIYAFDNYSVTQFDTDWRKIQGVFDILDNAEENFRPYCENRPLMVAELQAGWFGTWKGKQYDTIIEHLGRDHIRISTKTLLAQGLTIFNHYKAIGGTNWGLIGSTDTYTSYDFGAPIGENGLPNERFYTCKQINLLLSSFDFTATDRVSLDALPFQLSNTETLFAVRKTAPLQAPESTPESKNDPAHWLFFRNLTETTQTSSLTVPYCDTVFPIELSIQPHEMCILPYHVPLKNGDTVLFSRTELVYHSDRVKDGNYPDPKYRLVISGVQSVDCLIEISESTLITELKTHSNHNQLKLSQDCANPRLVRITAENITPDAFYTGEIGNLLIVILGQDQLDRLWLDDKSQLLIGPECLLDDRDSPVALNEFMEINVVTAVGSLEREVGFERHSKIELPELTHWKAEDAAWPLWDAHTGAYRPISKTGFDFDQNQLYEGSAWYRIKIAPHINPATVEIDARHLWFAFMNGKFLGNGTHILLNPGEASPVPSVLNIPPAFLKNKGEQELIILVDGLGHPKGFHDDASLSEGLLSLKINGLEIDPVASKEKNGVSIDLMMADFDAKHPLSALERLKSHPSETPVVKLETQFKLELSDHVLCPLGLRLEGIDAERINIYLNHTLIGRYWRACQRQNLFYLPEGLLRTAEGQKNTLSLVLINTDPLISLKYCQPSIDNAYLTSYAQWTKVRP